MQFNILIHDYSSSSSIRLIRGFGSASCYYHYFCQHFNYNSDLVSTLSYCMFFNLEFEIKEIKCWTH